jgi:hypothetical protein
VPPEAAKDVGTGDAVGSDVGGVTIATTSGGDVAPPLAPVFPLFPVFPVVPVVWSGLSWVPASDVAGEPGTDSASTAVVASTVGAGCSPPAGCPADPGSVGSGSATAGVVTEGDGEASTAESSAAAGTLRAASARAQPTTASSARVKGAA